MAQLARAPALKKRLSGEDRIALGAFLRQSGAYLALHAGQRPPSPDTVDRLSSLLLQSQKAVTHLAPIELIHLSEIRLAFDSFEIRKFDRSELAVITQNPVREAFYSYAALDLNVLDDYWYLVVTETVEVRPWLDLTDIFNPRVAFSYTGYPRVVEKALYALVLHDWVDRFSSRRKSARPSKRESDEEPFFPHIPFVLSFSDYWLEAPGTAPDTELLAREPYFDNEGEEVGDHPSYAFYFDATETAALQRNLSGFSTRLNLIEKHSTEWRFIYSALGFLTKAFLTNNMEQLLWHVTAIEAVLGQKLESGGLTGTLNRRIAEVFGGSNQDRKSYKQMFSDLYAFRSDLVHGNARLVDQKIMKGHLGDARDMARGVVAWAIGFLSHIANIYPSSEGSGANSDEGLGYAVRF
jgi:Apea-like HEPN